MADDIVYDEMLGELRTSDISGGTGGGGGSSYIAGSGLNLAGQTFSLATVEVQEVLNGTQTVKAVDVSGLRGALTAGQAVDVTSQPDSVTGDYKDTFSVTGSLGFASFPKYASGLNYLMIADLTATTSGTVTPSGTWLDGTTTAKSLAAGTPTRVAMLFNAANKAKFTFASTGEVEVSHCREYEVTACSNEAIAYIAALNNPDVFADYYLVKADMVQPWTSIIDMGTSPAVTIASGLSYKLNATTGTHELTVDACPAGYDGRDAIIRITLGGSGVIQAVPPLQLGGALIPYAVNNCTVRFRDGEAVLLVEDTLAGYVVTLTSGTGEGSLPYGLAATGVPYIAFSPSTDGIQIDLSGATTAAEEVTVVGNGYEETILTGSITCTSKTTVANLALQNVVVNGGTMTLGDAFIPPGSTVAVSGGGLAVEKVVGGGSASVIDLGGTHIESFNSAVNVSGCLFSGGSNNANGGAFVVSGGAFELTGCTLTGNRANGYSGAIHARQAVVRIVSCTITGNTAGSATGKAYTQTANSTQSLFSACYIRDNHGTGRDMYISAGSATISDCSIGGIGVNGAIVLTGSNTIDNLVCGSSARANVSSGAIFDFYENSSSTPISTPNGLIVDGGCTVITSAGSTVAVSGGTYTRINNDGTTVPPQE